MTGPLTPRRSGAHTSNIALDEFEALARRLSPAEADALARRVRELAAEGATPPPSGRLVDAATLAADLGVSLDFIYRSKDRLGAVRLPAARPERRASDTKPKPRLRFDLERARAAMESCSSSRRSPAAANPPSKPRKGARKGRAKGSKPYSLPIGGHRAA